MPDWCPIFESAHGFTAFLMLHGTADQQRQWQSRLAEITLNDAQHRVVAGFSRTVKVLCLAGAWCGDCLAQCPILQRIAESNDRIDLRFLDRENNAAVAEELRLCGGGRVPVVVFLSEDFVECGRYGDRTITTYRRMAKEVLSDPPPALDESPTDDSTSVVTDWVREFERIHLMLRLSPRLRRLHGD